MYKQCRRVRESMLTRSTESRVLDSRPVFAAASSCSAAPASTARSAAAARGTQGSSSRSEAHTTQAPRATRTVFVGTAEAEAGAEKWDAPVRDRRGRSSRCRPRRAPRSTRAPSRPRSASTALAHTAPALHCAHCLPPAECSLHGTCAPASPPPYTAQPLTGLPVQRSSDCWPRELENG